MKHGSKQGQKTKPITLTVFIVDEVQKRIESGLPLMSRSSKYLLLESIKVSKNTYQTWMRNGTVPVDAPKSHSLSQVVARARTEGRLNSAKQFLKHGSQKHLMSLLKMDLSVTEKSVRRYRDGKYVVKTELYRSVSPEILRLKLDASIFVLSALDPAYKN